MSIFLPNYFRKIIKFLFILFFSSCSNDKVQEKKYFKIERFDKIFYQSDSNSLDDVKKDYPFFFPSSYPDNIWVERLNDPIQKEIFDEIIMEFDSILFLETHLSNFFQNNMKLFKLENTPRVITVNTDIDYRNRIILTDTILLIGLDNYLGKNHRFYEGIPLYIKEDLTRNHIIKDVALQYAIKFTPKLDNYTFLDKIIYQGKLLYYMDISLNKTPENIKIGYSKNKLNWANENEFFVWTYFIENEILFNPDNKLNNRFINDAPFSRFYFENDNESTEMIGKYIGWKIVKSFMKNNDISVSDMMNTKQIEIYNKSKYKPKK